MKKNPLAIIEVERTKNEAIQRTPERKRKTRKNQYEPSFLQKEKREKIDSLIKKHIDVNGKQVVEFGSSLSGSSLPNTTFEDSFYDLVICTDVIAELHPHEHRLAISELSRIMKPKAIILCSTSLDIDSEDAYDQFKKLMYTEFSIIEWSLGYHAYTIKIMNLLKKPSAYWQKLDWLFTPFFKLLERKKCIDILEKTCHFLSPKRGISHAICIGVRKSVSHTQINS